MKRLFLLVFTLVIPSLHAQKVGLVLSGGGAKGFAHIGVIEILDSLEIPVDMVTGTSMGSIMGALYSIGYTGTQMRTVVNAQDWTDLMGASPARKYRSYEWKVYKEQRLTDFQLRGGKVGLPSGINSGQKIYAKLHEMMIGYHGDIDFNTLPRPFACVAVDLQSGKEIDFHSGSLPDVVRASMSIPSYFDPHPYKDMYLLDGGVLNNMPSDVIREMGADIIIGVNVSEAARKLTEDDLTITNVLVRSSMMGNQVRMQEHFAMCDLLIHPEIDTLSVLDFSNPEYIINLGKQKARKMIPQLLKIKQQIGARTNLVPPFVAADSINIGSVAFSGFEQEDPEAAGGLVGLFPGEKTHVNSIYQNLNYLWGTSRVTTTTLSMKPKASGEYDVTLQVREQKTHHTIGPGIRYDSDFGAAILLNYTGRNLFTASDLLSYSLVIGETFRTNFHYYFPLKNRFSVTVGGRYWISRPEFYLQRSFYGDLNQFDLNLFLGVAKGLSNHGELFLGLSYDYIILNTKDLAILNPNPGEFQRIEQPYISPSFGFYNDTYDKASFPYSGGKWVVKGNYYLPVTTLESADQPFGQLSINYRKVHRWFPRFAALYEVGFGQTVLTGGQSEVPFGYSYFAGSLGQNYFRNQVAMPGYRFQEYLIIDETGLYTPEGIAKLQLTLRYELFSNNYLSLFGAGAYVNGPGANPFDFFSVGDLIAGYGIGYGIDSFLGPLELAYHASAVDGKGYFYLNLGHWF